MLFKLLSIAFSVSLLVGLEAYAQQPIPYSYRNKLPALNSSSTSEIALRSDGRYLFYAQGQSAWSVVDLLGMVSFSENANKVKGGIVGLFYEGANRLSVVTTSQIEYFDVEKVNAALKETSVYSFPSSSNFLPMDACMDSQKKIFVLERDTDGDGNEEHEVRVIGPNKQAFTEKPKWADIFDGQNPVASDVIPVSILCAANSVLILGTYYDQTEDKDKLLIGRISLTVPFSSGARLDLLNSFPDYYVKDLVLDASGERLIVMLRADTPLENEEDTKVVSVSTSNLNIQSSINVGGGGQLLASFLRAANSAVSFFVEKDWLSETLGGVPEDQVLEIPTASIGNVSAILEDRGEGKAQLEAAEDEPSRWLSVSADHYAYGLIRNSVHLMSPAPDIEITSPPEDVELGASEALEFEFRSDEDVSYRLRIVSDLDLEGESSGLDNNRGKQVRSGELEAGEKISFQLTPRQMGVSKNGEQLLLIQAQRKFAGAGAAWARRGIRFNYDRPPPPVAKLRTGYGDRSVHVFFDPDLRDGDIKSFLIYASEDPTDLASLPSDPEELEAQWNGRKLRGHASTEISMPIEVPAHRWRGSYVIDPLENGREIYVRVQVIDDQSNFSSDNPSAVSGMPRATKSLTTAFGSDSCSLRPNRPFGGHVFLLAALFLGTLLGIRALLSFRA